MCSYSVLYDDRCSLCAWAKAWLVAHDTQHRLAFIGIYSPELAQQFPWLTPEAVRGAIHVVWPKVPNAHQSTDFNVTQGIRAFRVIVQQLPRWAWLRYLLYLPGALWLGDKAYVWIAKNRHKLPAHWFTPVCATD
jgi:predicted DCC family thiol-disulfide oxidoreductase YuxK